MDDAQLRFADAWILFGPVGGVPVPESDNQEGQSRGDRERDSPTPVDHRPGDCDRSECSSQAKAADLQSAGETALAQGGPRSDDAGYVRRNSGFADAREKTHDTKNG